MKRLLTIGHSYVVALNRRLADEMAQQGAGRWSVTAAAPARYPGDLGPLNFEVGDGGGCETRRLPMHLTKIPHLTFYSGIRKLMAEPWDLIHCWEEPYVAAGAQIAAMAPTAARFVFATFQNLPKTYPPPFRWFERRVLGRADGWIAFGQTVHETQMRRPGYAAVPSRVIPPGVDTRRFTPDADARARVRAERGWQDAVPVVGFLGRFVAQKGIDVLAAALRRVEGPWRALFVGGGDERRAIDALASSFPGRVSVATGVGHADVPQYLNAMDLICAPSQTTPAWREQFGRMLIEAMACGVPVLASRGGEIPHVVGDAALLIDEADVEAWSRGIVRVLADAGERRAMADRGLRRARTVFAWPAVARRHLEFFDELVARR